MFGKTAETWIFSMLIPDRPTAVSANRSHSECQRLAGCPDLAIANGLGTFGSVKGHFQKRFGSGLQLLSCSPDGRRFRG